MSRPKDKENDILTAAAEVFLEKGFSNTSVQDIADQAGLGKGTIYEYFKSKDELFVQSLKYDISKIAFIAKNKIPNNGTFYTKINKFIESVQDAFTENCRRFEYYMIKNISELSPQALCDFRNVMEEIRDDSICSLSEILKEGIAEGIIRTIDMDFEAYTIHGMIVMFCDWCQSKKYPEEKIKEEKDKLINMIMMGIGCK